MNKKKVLIITYYWPPAGGAGVQRWLKMSKYLDQFGWTPVIYTPEFSESPAKDASLLKECEHIEVIKRPIWEPYSLYSKLLGKKTNHTNYLAKGKKKSMVQKIAEWIRANVFIPDPRKYWIRPSINYLTKYCSENQIDALISTGPPHSMHLIAHGIKNKIDTPWIADFRDPWTFIDFFDLLPLSKGSIKKHKSLESAVINSATKRVVVSPGWKEEFENIHNKPFELIYNGFDKVDFSNQVAELDEDFTIVHIGSLNEDRNPSALWKSLSSLVENNIEFSSKLKIKLIGPINPSTIVEIKELGLESNLELTPYLPHQEVLKHTSRARLLLLLINDSSNSYGIIPGKLFEYIASGRPILCLGNTESDAANIAKSLNHTSISHDDQGLIQDYIEHVWQKDIPSQFEQNVEQYTREHQAEQYAHLLNEITESNVRN